MPTDTVPSRSNTATVAERLVMGLRRHGVVEVFGQSLPTPVHLAGRQMGLEQIAYRTEKTGGYMADGYARAAGRIGVVTSQNGPAAALLVPALAEALAASIPLVALVQEVPRAIADKNAFQEFDHEALFAPVAKLVRRLDQPERVDDYLDMAIRAATSGRPGPVVLMLPLDVLGEDAPPPAQPRESVMGQGPLDRPQPSPAVLEAAVRALLEAERPLVVAGGGVHRSAASATLARLQDLAALPVATTVMGKGAVDERHPLSLGVATYFLGTRGAAKFHKPLIDEADLVFLVGTRTNQNGTDSWTLYPEGARFIHLDIDPSEIGRNYEAMRLVGDARTTLEALLLLLENADLGARTAARAGLEARIAEGRARHRAEAAAVRESDAAPIRPERLMAELDARLTAETIVVADASYASIWTANYLHARIPGQRFLSPRGLAGLGWGYPMALGAKAAAPDAPVVAVVGDGGFAHAWAELETAVRMRLPVVCIVLDNGILAYQQHWEDKIFGDHTAACALGPVDHAKLAEACGCSAFAVETAAQIGPALDRALDEAATAKRPAVVVVRTDPEAFPPVALFER